MKLTQTNDVKVYTVAGADTARSLPEWIARKRKRSLKSDADYQSRIELVQDFGFPSASNRIRVSDDGQFCMATGTYKPQIHLYNFSLLSLSFSRHTSIENLTFELLGNSWTKSVHLQIDRSIEFHTPMGMHHKLRVPHYGRDLVYSPQLAEVIVPAEGKEIYRINLERGSFLKPFDTEDDVGEVLCGSTTSLHGLLAFGTDIGTTELFDPRARSRIGTIILPGKESIGALKFDPTGLTLATGSSEGLVRLYDLRSPIPLLTKDQGYSYPIQNILFLPPVQSHGEIKVLSADKRIIKIWSPKDGKPWTSMEPSVDINDVAYVPETGMIFTANEGPDMHTFFIPELGPAPRWCSFLDNLTEEMEESMISSSSTGLTTYDNYKFLTKPELESLSLSHLVGTGVLRPYMHGFFIKQELYEQAKLISNPWGWEEERKRLIQAKIDKERESRIRNSGKKLTSKVKVNKKLAERLVELEEKMERKAAKKKAKAQKADVSGSDEEEEEKLEEGAMGDEEDANMEKVPSKSKGILQDERFRELFSNPDFTVDETSAQWRLHNPSSRPTLVNGEEVVRKKTAVEDEEDSTSAASSNDESDASSGSDYGANYKSKETRRAKGAKAKVEPQMRISTSSFQTQNHEKQIKMPIESRDQSFGARLATGGNWKKKSFAPKPSRNANGEMEMTWNVEKKPKNRGPLMERNSSSSFKKRRDDNRRSASGNAFRKLGV